MQLSDFFPQDRVLRNTGFELLALSNSQAEGRVLSFLEDARYADEMNSNQQICAVICKKEMVSSLAPHIQGVVLSDTPRRDYFLLHNHLAQSDDYCPPLAESKIPDSCKISPLAYIAPYGVELGENVVIEEFVSIKGPCRIGSHTVIHAGAKIGGDGFEFKVFEDDVLDVVHCGGVEIGDNVILWENVTVHKAVYPWDKTVIAENARIGAGSHVDHGAKVGAFSKVCAGTVISGRTQIGDHAYIGPGTILSNRLHVGAHAHTVLGSVVTKDVPDGQQVSGNFAIDHQKHIQDVKRSLD